MYTAAPQQAAPIHVVRFSYSTTPPRARAAPAPPPRAAMHARQQLLAKSVQKAPQWTHDTGHTRGTGKIGRSRTTASAKHAARMAKVRII